MTPRLKDKFNKEVLPNIAKEFGIKNPMALPKLSKIVLNVGMGKELDGTKLKPQVKDQVLKDLSMITGQKPVMVVAKKAVSNFKVRDGYETHAMVTLRGARMWEFLDRLISLALPRVKDFRGLSDTSFDKAGNYGFGVTEQGIFPEINMAEATYTHGFNININFLNSKPEITKAVLKQMGWPFRRPEDKKR
jgi:large subunit ribosomal protein L5